MVRTTRVVLLALCVLAPLPGVALTAGCPLPAPTPQPDMCVKSFKCIRSTSEWIEVYMPAGATCHDDGCEGTCSADGSCGTLKCPPDAPSAIASMGGGTLDSYKLSWSATRRAQWYELTEASSATGSTRQAYSGKELAQTFSAQPSATYGYTLRACNSDGCNPTTSTKSVVVPAPPASLTVPTQASTGDVTLTWTAVTGATNYWVLEDGVTSVSAGSATTLIRTNLLDGTHRYQVRACTSLVCGSYSVEKAVRVVRIPPAPAPITSSTSTSATGRYAISWKRPAGYIVDGYILERKFGSEPWRPINLGPYEGFAETQSTNGIYSYRVAAFNTSGTSPTTGVISVTVAIPTPTPEQEPNANPFVPEQQYVGALKGSPSVEGGAATYSIPIDVPPGRQGMQPSVALSYTSRGGNGVAGVGWSVSGSSTIYRCPAMLARSGKNAPVLHQSEDKLCLDGQQLVMSGGNNYGSSSTEYHTEIDTFARVTQRGGTIQSWDSYFRVEHKNGHVSIYRALSSNVRNAVPDTWRLVREFDPHGNCLDYQYTLFSTRSGGGEEWVIDHISYTGMRSSAGSGARVGDDETCVVSQPARTVSFEYAQRPDIRTTFDTGAASPFSARLSAISTLIGTNPQRRYELGYVESAATKRSLLADVKVCAGASCNGAQLPPTHFTYQQDEANFTWTRPVDAANQPLGADWQNQLAADFDGDGTRDVEFRHLVNGSWTREIQLTTCGVAKLNLDQISTFANLLQSADLDNDGRAELVGASAGQLVMVKLSCSSGVPAFQKTLIANMPQLGAETLPPHAQDYDGDGRIDLAYPYKDSSGTLHTRICFHTKANAPNWSCSAGVEKPGRPSSVEGEVFERDINGDGRVDVLFDTSITTSGSASIAFLNADLTWDRRSLQSLGGPSSTFTSAAAKFIWLDVNGDGLPDIYQSGNPPYLDGTVWINHGGVPGPGMFQAVSVGALGVDIRRLKYARAMDVDADGRDELLVPESRAIGYCGGPGMPTCPGSEVPTCIPGEPCQIPEDKNPASGTGAGGTTPTNQCETANGNNAWCGDEFDCTGAADAWDYSVFHWKAYRLQEAANGTFAAVPFDPHLRAPIQYPFTEQEDFFGDGMMDVSFRLVDTWVTCPSSGTRIKRGYYGDNGANARGPIIARNTARAPDLMVRADAGVTSQQSSGSFGVTAAWSYYPLSADSYWSYAVDDHPNACSSTGARFYKANLDGSRSPGYAYFTSSMWTVSQFDISNGSQNGPELNTTCYRYEDAMLNLEGRGFQGFKSITAEERFAPAAGEVTPPASSAQQGPCGQSEVCSANNKVSTTTFFQEYPLAGRQATSTVVLASDPSKKITSETFAWNAQDTSWSGKVVFPQSQVSDRYELEASWLVRQTTISDQFDATSGEVTRNCSILQHSPAALASVHSGTTLQDVIKYETREVENFTTDWWVGRLKSVTTTSDYYTGAGAGSVDGCPSLPTTTTVKSVRMEYTWYPDGTAGRERSPESERMVVKGIEESKTTFAAYDNFGNLQTRSVVARGVTGTPFVTTYGSTSTGSYFTETERNAAGHLATTTFDPATGAPLTKQAVQNGPTARYAYDALGRLLTTTTDGSPPVHERLAACPDCGEIVLSRQTIQAGAPTKTEFFDRLGRVVQTQMPGFDGKPIVSAVDYNERGAKVVEYPPYVCPSTGCPADTGAFSPFPTTYSNLDPLGRVGRKTVLRSAALFAAGKGEPNLITDYAFSGLNTQITVQNPVGSPLAMSRAYDGRGKLVETMQEVTDASGHHPIVTRYLYDPTGSVTHIVDTKGNDLAAAYDDLGRKVREDDPDRGTWTYFWDGLGRLAAQKDAKGTQLTFAYDAIGRMTSRYVTKPGETNPRLEGTWGYDENGFTGFPTSLSGRNVDVDDLTSPTSEQYRREIHYDLLRRQDRVTTHILLNPNGAAAPARVQTMAVDYGYDATFGWLKTVRYPTGDGIYLDYNAFGYQRGEAQLLADGSRGLEYRRVTEMTPQGKVAHQTLWKTDGTGAPAIDYDAEYDSGTGLMFFENAQQAVSTTLRQLKYLHDHYLNLQSQELTLPKGTGYGTFTETYSYDELQRLRGAARSWSSAFNRANEQTTYEYDDLGNITKKDDYAAAYTYGEKTRATRLGGPHAVIGISGKKDASSAQFQYDLNGNLVSGDHRTIAFDYLDRPTAITYDGATDSFWYAPDGTRFMQRAPGKTVYYLDKDIEYFFYDTGTPQTKLYLSDAVEVVLDDSAPSKTAYKVFDQLGSLLATTDGVGTELPADGHSFDPFGGPRAADGTPSGDKLHPAGDFGTVTNRGFTEHEHLDDVYLIHMNGRAYDYRLGRFLSVDPVISDKLNSQSFNPYSYVGNNPLSATDPSGYLDRNVAGGLPLVGSHINSVAFSKTVVYSYNPSGPAADSGAKGQAKQLPGTTASATGEPKEAAKQDGTASYSTVRLSRQEWFDRQIHQGNLVGYAALRGVWDGTVDLADVAMNPGGTIVNTVTALASGKLGDAIYCFTHPTGPFDPQREIEGLAHFAGSMVPGALAGEALGALGAGAKTEAATQAASVEAEVAQARPSYVPRSKDGSPLPLPRGPNGELAPSSGAPHTQIGWQEGRRGGYIQTREFGRNGEAIKQVDWTDHGRPNQHTNPHVHDYIPNPTGGTPQHGDPRPPRRGEL